MKKEIEEIMLTVSQKIVAYDGNPAGQHLYGEQRQEIAEALYNAGYRKIDENCAVITKDDLKLYQKQDVKEFADKLKAKTLDETYRNKDFNIHISDIYKMIEETLKEYE